MKKNIQKIVAGLLMFCFAMSIFARPAKAEIWGESLYYAMDLKQMLEEIYKKMDETIVATLKTQAIRTINTQMKTMMGGAGGGQQQIVQNWEDTIYGSANKEANLVVKDYFSQTKSAAGGTGGQRIVAAGEKMYNTDPTMIKPTIDQYVPEGRVDRIFDTRYTPNPAQALNDLSKMRNYPAFYAMNAQGLYAVKYGEKAGAESAKNIAYGGVKATEKTSATGEENITMPGSIKKDTLSQVMNMPTTALATAQSIPQVIASAVLQMLNQLIGQGFSMVNQQMNRAQSAIRGQTGGSIPQIQGLIQQGRR